MRIEGKIVGFDEFMNIVVSEAEEVYTEKAKGKGQTGRPGTRRDLGRILLKGDNIVSGTRPNSWRLRLEKSESWAKYWRVERKVTPGRWKKEGKIYNNNNYEALLACGGRGDQWVAVITSTAAWKKS